MWIARNQNGDLYLYDKKPTRKDNHFKNERGVFSLPFIGLSDANKYNKCTWENSPIELVLKEEQQ